MSVLTDIDRAIRLGQVVEAKAMLESLSAKTTLASLDHAQLANLFWRVGLPARGVQLLARRYPLADDRIWNEHPKEGAEYAACLLRLGAIEEAKWVLGLEAVAASPRAPLYQGFAHVERWEYADAIPHFVRYTKQKTLPAYQRLIGYANLMAAQVYEEDFRGVKPVIRRLLQDSQLSRHTFLLGYVLEMAAAAAVLQGDTKLAAKRIEEAKARWGSAEAREAFSLRKWEAVMELKRCADDEAIGRARGILREGMEQGYWEAARDTERHLALATGDKHHFFNVYFGTPYASFRERLRKKFGAVDLPPSHPWPLGEGEAKPQTLGLLTDRHERAKRGLKGQLAATLAVVASDRYRPPRIASLFAALHPDEIYQPLHAGKRSYEVVRRLNAWFEEQKLPLRIEVEESQFHLHASQPVHLLVPLPEQGTEEYGPLLSRIRTKFGAQPFALKDALQAFPIPRRTLIRQLQSLAAADQLQKTGKGIATRYSLGELNKESEVS